MVAVTVLALAPHPDDETLGCGGFLRLAADEGQRTVVVFLTSGEAGVPGHGPDEARRIREREAEAAASVLGVARTVFLGGADWRLDADAERIAPQLRRTLEEESPTELLLPHRDDGHRDHRAAWPLLGRSLPDGLEPDLLCYEVWTPMAWFDDARDIGAVMPRKLAALACHASQLTQVRYDAAAEGLARYRGALSGGCEFAEAFRHEAVGPLRPTAGDQAVARA